MKHYDCVIMGAGFAGVCLARHLLLRIPGISVALIDPRGESRGDRDLKVGESMVEIASLFVAKELGLHNYMIENHTPKAGLNFHWPREPDKTESKDDYYSIWTAFTTAIPSFHLNRAKFEHDVLQMNRDMGADFYSGHVVDFDLTGGDAPNRVLIASNGEKRWITATHLVDASGRKFLIGRRLDNVIRDTDDLFGVANSSVWLRVRNSDRTIFDDDFHPDRSTTSFYYATNHFMGHGHWIWMIPAAKEENELSIGVVFHRDKIGPEQLAKKEDFLAFLAKNHTVLYRLIQSGDIVDFHRRGQIAYRSKQMFGPGNWYIVGDAAYIIDAFYSLGTSTIAIAIESISELIRASMAAERDAAEKRTIYNRFNVEFARLINGLFRDHGNHIGNASVMSWRIYIEWMWWFGFMVPMYAGRWHLNSKFAERAVAMMEEQNEGFFADMYAMLTEVANSGKNIGLLDPTRKGFLFGDYSPYKIYDNYINNTKFGPQGTNLFQAIKNTNLYSSIWYLKLNWRARGMRGLLARRTFDNLARLTKHWAGAGLAEALFRIRTRNTPDNREVHQQQQEFASYRPTQTLQPWRRETPSAGTRSARSATG
ncbi:MAG: tryptophan 7-halogenase [Proteobacteria bacterium]|nr:tryptophan 7-halogenase [Pseudomonadota bacterium]